VVADPANFSLLGKDVTSDDTGSFTRAVGESVGLKSFDNAYALIYIGFGAIPLAVFIGIGLVIARWSFRSGLTLVERAWLAVVLATFVNLTTVDLLTQLGHLFWMALGLIAATMQRHDRRGADEPHRAAPAPSLVG
jgi:hypothetical protein